MKRLITTKAQIPALCILLSEALQKRGKIMVSMKPAPKTLEQLGYLHSCVLPKLAMALSDSGEIKHNSEREAKYWLKRHIDYGQFFEFGCNVVFDPDSFADASLEILSQAIDCAIDEAALRDVIIEPSKTNN